MKTIGEILKTERLKHHVSVPDFANRSKIRPEYIIALEENRFTELPAAIFVKGFIRSYARAFGFDYQPLLGLLRRDYRESAVGTLVPSEFIKPMLKKRQMWTPVTWLVLGLATVFLTLMGYVGVQYYNLQKPPILTVDTPEENAFVKEQVSVHGSTIPDGIVTVNLQPVALQPDGSFQTDVYIPKEGIHTVTIEVEDRRGKKNMVQRTVHVQE